MTLDEYLSRDGSVSMAEFARAIGVNQDQVRQWRHETDGRRPSHTSAALIERGTDGAVTCEELRPDLVWTRIKDKSYGFHPKGRPLLEVAVPG